MIVLSEIYNDIVSKINAGAYQNEILAKDILLGINEAISQLRIEYVMAGYAQSFAITEERDTVTRSATYPFLLTATLSQELLKRAPVSKSVIAAIGYKSTIVLNNGNHTRTVGDIAYRVDEDEQHLLECVESYTDKNHYDLFFRPAELRQYRQDNKLKYKAGEVVFDGDHYWKIVADFVNDGEFTFVESAPGANQIVATKLYWKEIGEAFVSPVFVEFDRINELKLATRSKFSSYSIKDNVLYASPELKKIAITYVPEWTYVSDLTTQLRIPYDMVDQVKRRTLAGLAIKFPGAVKQDEQ